MKKIIVFLCLFSTLLITMPVFANSVKLTLKSYTPATFPTISEIIDITDINDQLEISRRATLFALSAEGWNFGSMGLGGVLAYREPDSWSGHLYFADIPIQQPIPNQYSQLFGYPLDSEALKYNIATYYVYFHTDEWVERLSHDIGESPNNFGVISGGLGGDWMRCAVSNWGLFYVEEINGVPEPTTILLLGFGLIGLAGIRRRFKK